MYCSLPTFQGFLPFFAQTKYTFPSPVVKPLKLQKTSAHILEGQLMKQLLDTQLLIVGRSYYEPERPKFKVP